MTTNKWFFMFLSTYLIGVISGSCFSIFKNPNKPPRIIHWEQKDVPCVDGEHGTQDLYMPTSNGSVRKWILSLRCDKGEADFKITERKGF
jgi:hypothetical protein